MQEETTSEKAAVLNPKYREVTANNEKFIIKPWTLGQIARVSDYLVELGISFGSLDMNFNNMGVDDALVLASRVLSRPTFAFKIIADTLQKDVQWVENLDGDEGVDVFTAIIQVNQSFFRRLQAFIPTQAPRVESTEQPQSTQTSEAPMTGSTSSET